MADTATAPASARGPVSYAPFTFQQAVRRARPARIAIEGPSGYGRTPWALKLAQRLGERLAVIDTERGKAAEYAAEIPFSHLILSDDFNPSHLIDALASAAAIRSDVLVIDGHSAFWSGAGGLLDLVGKDTQPGIGGKDAGWRKNRPLLNKVTEALHAYPGHVILTLRSTTETFIEEDAAGRHIPVRHSVKAQQRDGLEYDMDLYGSLITPGKLHIVKSSIPELPIGEVLDEPGEQTATYISTWARNGEPLEWADFVRAAEMDTPLDDLIELRERMRVAHASHMALPGPNGVQSLEEILKSRITLPVTHVDAALAVWDDREGLLHRLSVAEAEGVDKKRVQPSGTNAPVVLRDWIIARGRALGGASPSEGAPTPPQTTPTAAEQSSQLPPFEPVGLPVDPEQWTEEHRDLVNIRDMAQQTWNVAEELRTTLEVTEKQGLAGAEALDTDTLEIQRLGDLLDARLRLLDADPD
ncbi:AAA family ATPase [Streptomyces mirabilis]|uniref:AAA family ATPase n=1 Tax=Streptomyces mirabilis TaxID=68239 RepID=UPI0033E8B9F3